MSLASHQKGAGLIGGQRSRMLRGNPPFHPPTDTQTQTVLPCTLCRILSSRLALHSASFLPLGDSDWCGIMEHMSSPVRFRSNKKGRHLPAWKHNTTAAEEL